MKLSRDDNVKQLVVEFQNGKFSECEKEAISLLEHYKDDYFLYNFLGLCQYKLKKFSQSINTYKSAIKIKKANCSNNNSYNKTNSPILFFKPGPA